MAGPIMMGKVVERARDLNVMPLWQSMPVAIEAAGATRTVTPESAASVRILSLGKMVGHRRNFPTKTEYP